MHQLTWKYNVIKIINIISFPGSKSILFVVILMSKSISACYLGYYLSEYLWDIKCIRKIEKKGERKGKR